MREYDILYNNYHFIKIEICFDIEYMIWKILEDQFNKELTKRIAHNIINLYEINIKAFSIHIKI